MFFYKYFFLFLVSFIRNSLNFLDFIQNLCFGIFAEALNILAVVDNWNINCCFVLLFCISCHFRLNFLFWHRDSVKGVAVNVAVVIFSKIWAIWMIGGVQLADKTLLIFIFDNLVQITFKSEHFKSLILSSLSPWALSPNWLKVILYVVEVLFFEHEVIQKILNFLPDKPFCDRC